MSGSGPDAGPAARESSGTAAPDGGARARRRSIEATLQSHGLQLRGGWVPGPADAVPSLPADRPVAVVWMVGQVGSAVWPHFAASAQARDGRPDPLDRWAKSIGQPLAAALGGLAIFPSDGPPWPPFQRWAQRADPARPSPLGLLLHPAHGLWHAWRFALALPTLHSDDAAELHAQATQRPPVGEASALCAACSGQPCLHTCPVQAFQPGRYDVDACAAHLHTPQGEDCMGLGCRARRACPVGGAAGYGPTQAAFHMTAFARPRREA